MRRDSLVRICLISLTAFALLACCTRLHAIGESVTSTGPGDTAVAAGDVIWFRSLIEPLGSSETPVTFTMTNTEMTSTGAASDPIPLPEETVTLQPSAIPCSAAFDAGSKTWFTILPSSLSGAAFLSHSAYVVPAPGGADPFARPVRPSAGTKGTGLDWYRSGAAYTDFAEDPDGDHPTRRDYSVMLWTPASPEGFSTGGSPGGGWQRSARSHKGAARRGPDPVPSIPDAPTIVFVCYGTLQLLAVRKKLFR